jgi:hypothetical protein
MFSQLLKLFPRTEFQGLVKRTLAERHARIHVLGAVRGYAVLSARARSLAARDLRRVAEYRRSWRLRNRDSRTREPDVGPAFKPVQKLENRRRSSWLPRHLMDSSGPRLCSPVPRGTPQLTYSFFGGKGGVGKTVLAGATALALAGQGRRTLLASTNPVHSLSGLLAQNVAGGVTAVDGVSNLWAYEIDTRETIERSASACGSARTRARLTRAHRGRAPC